MALYVDDARWGPPTKAHGHLFGAPLEDLHALARSVGLGTKAFVALAVLPHYAIPAELIPVAIERGAKPVASGGERGRAIAQVRGLLDRQAPTSRPVSSRTAAPQPIQPELI